MLDVSVTYNRFKFLGHQYLTWLWYAIETGICRDIFDNKDQITLALGNRIVLENRRSKDIETVTIKGDTADLKEGKLALSKGALVTEIALKIEKERQLWSLSLKGESLGIGNLKLPETGIVQTSEDFDGAVLEKIYLDETAISIMNKIFHFFIKQRVGENWDSKITGSIKKWIAEI